ncbi:hypothetical protein AURDEDRAFT_111327 [Auricularia subglabra TFB-10046 SS5]|nr:hypothetical protein AURDEDRAFT_111327 [Auricularia subglabra TFB-10046 SS5]
MIEAIQEASVRMLAPRVGTFELFNIDEPAQLRFPASSGSFRDFVTPPEMPEAVKAEAEKGTTCYYGFEFPDTAVADHDTARNIDRPEDYDPAAWIERRKHLLTQEKAGELGIYYSAHLAYTPPERASVPNASHEDIVWCAVMRSGRLICGGCPPPEIIQQLMQALFIEGEPRWIVA